MTDRIFSRLLLALLAALALAGAGCTDREAVTVRLQTRPTSISEILQLEVDALVSGTLAGLHYKWLAVSGSCLPQESDQPVTRFTFAQGVTRDRITVEVWRGDRLVGRAESDVDFDGQLAHRTEAAPAEPDVFIEVTTVPPREPGGEHTRADIAGRITGRIEPDYRVIVYARAYDNWYIQPNVQAQHVIKPDGSWGTWTHTGDSYAVLVVRSNYVPMVRLDVLPTVGGAVKARKIIEGK